MADLQTFLARCDAVAARLNISRTALSNRLLFDSRRLDEIAGGKDIGVRRLARAEADLSRMEADAAAERAAAQHREQGAAA